MVAAVAVAGLPVVRAIVVLVVVVAPDVGIIPEVPGVVEAQRGRQALQWAVQTHDQVAPAARQVTTSLAIRL